MTLLPISTRCADRKEHDGPNDTAHTVVTKATSLRYRRCRCFSASAQPKRRRNGMTTDVPGALPDIHLVSPVANGQWTMPAGDYGNTRYSPLNKINTGNVQNLHVVRH